MLVYCCFLLIVIAAIKFEIAKTLVGTVLKAALIFGGVVVFVTEIISLFRAINVICLYGVWGLIAIILLFVILRNRRETLQLFSIKKQQWIASYKSLFWYEKAIVWLMPFLVFPLLYQGIIYPPNNWDSLTYHMSRIMYWIGNESVAHFPARISRLLYQPPFAEFLIMNINLTNGHDYMSNSVQLFFMVLSAFGVYAILDVLKIPRFYRLVGMLIVLTIPSVELQATTAKNDIVCGFFLLSSIYFCVMFYRKNTIKHSIFLGLSIGLAMLTKGTSYIYLTPVLGIFGIAIFIKVIKTRDISSICQGLASLMIVGLLNTGHFSRNYKVDGSLITVDTYETKSISNDVMNGKFFVSNLLKNAGLHLGAPIDSIADKTIRKIHKDLGISIDDPRTNYIGVPYEGARAKTTHEDYIPNTLLFFLLNVALLVVIFYSFRNFRSNSSFLLLALVLIIQILLFSLVLKWQPWHTRLQIPIFLLSAVLVSCATYLSKAYRYLAFCFLPFVLYDFGFYFMYNDLRPIAINKPYTKSIRLSDLRLKKYFSNQPMKYAEYSAVIDKMFAVNDLEKIGLIMSDWEYPLVRDLYYDHVQLLALNTTNPTSNIFQDTKGINVIISDIENKAFIDYEGKKYTNQTPNNTYIWIYKP